MWAIARYVIWVTSHVKIDRRLGHEICPVSNKATTFCCVSFQVARRSDIDMNGHINNVTYLGWALETVPLDTFLTCKLHQVLPC